MIAAAPAQDETVVDSITKDEGKFFKNPIKKS